jgi:type III restriction enzyme
MPKASVHVVRDTERTPIQPVERPILCDPYVEPNDHWVYDTETGEASHGGTRRLAGYWYKTDKTGTRQQRLFIEEERDDLPLVNMLREDVRRWRESDYRGATSVTRELLQWWVRDDRLRRLFFCQREAVETVIYLSELRLPGKSRRTGFQKFAISDEDLQRLLRGEKPGFELQQADFFPSLVDPPAAEGLLGLQRLGCKMATGAGKTVVMSMLIAWAFCNRGRNPASRE